MPLFYSNPPTLRARTSVKNIAHLPFWQTTVEPFETPEIDSLVTTDVLVVGGGFTGLWSAIQLATRFPYLSVTLVDKATFAGEATSRNGGFIHATLTHGFENSLQHWPRETQTLIELGYENLNAIKTFVKEHSIDCDWVDAGELETAFTDTDVRELQQQVAKANHLGLKWQFLDEETLNSRIRNPKFRGASFDPDGVATINPAKLAHGLVNYLKSVGVKLFQDVAVTDISVQHDMCTATHQSGVIRANKVIVATGAHFFAHPMSRLRTIPIYDYSIVSRVLKPEEVGLLGWSNREGIIDTGNQFHYYRLTPDNRILWGGYAANYHFGNAINEKLTYPQQEFEQLAEDFFSLFDQLQHVDFEFGWGGVIDTCSRFVPFFQKSHAGKVVQVAGFTGLGVATSRFAADVMVDLLFELETKRSTLSLVRKKPLPFPPEPIRSFTIWLTRASLVREDKTGRRNLWLRLLDALGVGFDS